MVDMVVYDNTAIGGRANSVWHPHTQPLITKCFCEILNFMLESLLILSQRYSS